MRRNASHPPRATPCLSTAWLAYREQVGSNRHAGGNIGDNANW